MARPQCVHENAGTDPDYKMTKIDNKYRFQYDWPAAGKTPRQGRAGLPEYPKKANKQRCKNR